jgi:ribosomal protein L11 methyltransferase
VTFNALVLELEAEEADRLSDALLEFGALSVTCDDAQAGASAGVAWFDEGADIALWPRLKLTVLTREQDDPEQALLRACAATGIAPPAFDRQTVADQDWVEKSREQFAPIPVSERLWIVPSWHSPPDPAAINIALDPGLAFGTGSHPSTRLCLQWLEQNIAGGETVLDYGCGSGILAIAALKLGARRAVGIDIDPSAVAAARANARRNGVADEFFESGESLDLTADIVVANILANPLIVLAPLLVSHCTQGGRIALAGILESQERDIRRSYAQWISFFPPARAQEWVCLSGVRLQ